MRIERVAFAAAVIAYLVAVGAVASYQPDHFVLFGRVFVATVTGLARTVGL